MRTGDSGVRAVQHRVRDFRDLPERSLTIAPATMQEIAEREEILRRRLTDPDTKKNFRHAYTFKVGYDYSTLKPYCEDIIQAVDGYAEHIDIARAKMEVALQDYDSDHDVLVMAGRSFDNLLVGMIVVQKVLQKPKVRQSFAIAVYYMNRYKFYELPLDPTLESHEIYIA